MARVSYASAVPCVQIAFAALVLVIVVENVHFTHSFISPQNMIAKRTEKKSKQIKKLVSVL